MTEAYVSRSDVEQYVYDTLPWTETADWNIDAIADEMLTAWPDLIGWHAEVLDYPIPNSVTTWIDHHIDGERYWGIVEKYQVG
jgi:hypothetical protein